ncbi:MAG: PqqD family protein [Acidobacteriota bacterium]
MSASSNQRFRPRRRAELEAFPVADELVLLAPSSDRAYALNRSGAAIWELCDGRHALPDMLAALRESFAGDDVEILADITSALFEMEALELVETTPPSLPQARDEGQAIVLGEDRERPVHFVFGVEDRPYFHWQLAIFFESLVGQLPAGWSTVVVVCNGHREVSTELTRIAETYGAVLLTGESLGDRHDLDFSGGGERYVPLNRVEALAVVAGHVAPDDVVCLMDTDLFLVGELRSELFPSGNAMAENWIISQERYFQFSDPAGGGLSLPGLLTAMGFERDLVPGGVTVFLTGETLQRRKYIQDCFRFLQILYLIGKVSDLPAHGVWVAEMACFALAAVSNAVDVELLDAPQFAVPEPGTGEVPDGTFFHYYVDHNDGGGGPFPDSEWHKQLFQQRDLLRSDLGQALADARSPVETRFFEIAIAAQERIHGTPSDSPPS